MNAVKLETVKDLTQAYESLINQSPALLPQGSTALVRVLNSKTGRRTRSDTLLNHLGEDNKIEILFGPAALPEPLNEITEKNKLVENVFSALYDLEETEVMDYTVLTWFLKKHLPSLGFSQPHEQLRDALGYLIQHDFVVKSYRSNPKNVDIPVSTIEVNRNKLVTKVNKKEVDRELVRK